MGVSVGCRVGVGLEVGVAMSVVRVAVPGGGVGDGVGAGRPVSLQANSRTKGTKAARALAAALLPLYVASIQPVSMGRQGNPVKATVPSQRSYGLASGFGQPKRELDTRLSEIVC